MKNKPDPRYSPDKVQHLARLQQDAKKAGLPQPTLDDINRADEDYD